jgi:Rap1a immunity proteins
MRVLGIFLLLGATCIVWAQDGKSELIYTSADLLKRCSGNGQDRQICFAYIRGFSDGNRWLLRDEPVAPSAAAPHAVCVPNSEPIEAAADLLVARFRGRASEVNTLSPFRALSMSLSQRYPC